MAHCNAFGEQERAAALILGAPGPGRSGNKAINYTVPERSGEIRLQYVIYIFVYIKYIFIILSVYVFGARMRAHLLEGDSFGSEPPCVHVECSDESARCVM